MRPDFYARNEAYSDKLKNEDPRRYQSLPVFSEAASFHGKFTAALEAGRRTGESVLDVGCGVGQVVRALAAKGFEARGVDVSRSSVALSGEALCQVYEGRHLPFDDQSMHAVGACNVLEHVQDPVFFLDEMNRVLKSGGKMVVSSPNFLRVAGWRDYHPQMQGLGQKFRNLQTLFEHYRLYRQDDFTLKFESMPPIQREFPRPDDDATVATNALDLSRYFRVRGFRKITVSCVDRPLPRLLELMLDSTPMKYGILNAFVTAEKS